MDNKPENKRVLVTGGTGYVASHTIVGLLSDGWQVRTTARSAARAESVYAAVEAGGIDPTGLEVAVADLSSDEGWADAVKGCEYVLHVASPFPAVAPADEDELISPARDGALRVLRAARDSGVRRVVLMSSFAAVGYSHKEGSEYDETDWTDPADDNTAYIKSKAIAELAAWRFMADEGGDLELTVINPVGIFGPVLGNHLSVSTGIIKAMLLGAMPMVPRTYFGVVDVRDVVDIQLRAMTNPDAAGQRFLASSTEAVSFLQLGQILARRFAEYASQVPAGELADDDVRAMADTNPQLREAVSQLGRVPVINSAKARSVLGWTSRDVEETVVDTAVSLIDAGLL